MSLFRREFLALLILIFTSPFGQAASPFCSGALNPEFWPRPAIGVYVEVEGGDRYLSLGSYFGGSHQELIRNLHRGDLGPISRVLWAGELVIEFSGGPVITRANETSGFIYELISGDTPYIPEDLSALDISSASSSSLLGFTSLELNTAEDYEAIAFDEENERLFEAANLDAVTSRHGMGNVLAGLVSFFDIRSIKSDWELRESLVSDAQKILDLISAFRATELHPISAENEALLVEAESALRPFFNPEEFESWTSDQYKATVRLFLAFDKIIYDGHTETLIRQR